MIVVMGCISIIFAGKPTSEDFAEFCYEICKNLNFMLSVLMVAYLLYKVMCNFKKLLFAVSSLLHDIWYFSLAIKKLNAKKSIK